MTRPCPSNCPFVRASTISHLVTLFSVGISVATARGADPTPALTFERDIWPIVAANCVGCHGADKPKAGLDLRTVSRITRCGKGGPILSLADPDSSLIIEKIAQGEMPPGKARKLSAEEVAKVRDWLRAGARADHPDAIPSGGPTISDADRRFWSFRMLQKPPVPKVAAFERARAPIDRFLLARLEAKGLSFSADAEPATLARRLCLDLTGIPPSPDLVDAYESDKKPGAYERLVDRVLASPQFGERWGRHWLDVAGYVDTVGFDTDATNIITSEGKWRYRDYVIAAFNHDKPYDQFVTEQLAADELNDWRKAPHWTPEMREALIATGYLRTARDLTQEDVGVIPQNFFGILHDTLEITGTGLLGLTVDCARCHNHWKMRLRRLEAEAVRDAILATSGDLDQVSGGPPVLIKARPDGMVTVAQDGSANPGRVFRRSVYLTARRAYNVSLLTVFDQPLIATNCVKRKASALPLQSLFMLNDAFLAQQADHFARRIERSMQTVGGDAVEPAFRLALARQPNAHEIATCRDLLRSQAERYLSHGVSPREAAHQALTQLCLTLYNTSEFLFAE